MFLRNRLNQAEAPAAPEASTGGTKPLVAPKSVEIAVRAADPLADLKSRVHRMLVENMRQQALDETSSPEQIKEAIREVLETALASPEGSGAHRLLARSDRDRLVEEIYNDMLGLGPLEPLLGDDSISEIMVNNPRKVYVERGGRITKIDVAFSDDGHLLRVIDRIVSKVGRRIDESSPMCDARLPDGSRVNAIIPPLAIDGPCLTIRKFRKDPLKVDALIDYGSLTQAMAEFLKGCVEARLNILISGGTGSGKTTLLNVFSAFIPHHERLITIEDAAELQLQQDHVIRLETRPANVEGAGRVDQSELVKNSLRMRPDRIILGEVRGGEALSMLQAMNTGHEGSLATIHANSARDALSRLETMVLMAGMDLPLRAIREQIASAINLIVQIGRASDGSRRVLGVSELVGMEGDTLQMQEIYQFARTGVDEEGRITGAHRPTGIRPKCADALKLKGIPLPVELFQTGSWS
ncbi:CpaF family protein [bacterium]|nr:CpaF family protein [bacterium]